MLHGMECGNMRFTSLNGEKVMNASCKCAGVKFLARARPTGDEIVPAVLLEFSFNHLDDMHEACLYVIRCNLKMKH